MLMHTDESDLTRRETTMSELEHKRRSGPATDAEIAGRLLAAAKPRVDAAREAALLDRIMATTERTPRLAVVTANTPITAAPPRRAGPRRDMWAAAGALAASLVIGFIAGQMSLPRDAVYKMAEATGVSLSSATQDVAQGLAAAETGDDD
jgi:hypothetical protein